tara:strand:+ start:697 stop:1020 length:324 start_codon:yes stop_codon:yes gene_type:complete
MGAKGIGPRGLGVSPLKQTTETKNAITIDGSVSKNEAEPIPTVKNTSVSGGLSYQGALLNASVRADTNKNYRASVTASNKKGNISGGVNANSTPHGKSLGASFTLKF